MRRLLLVSCLFIACGFTSLAAQERKTQPEIFAHYMPWYGSKEISGAWGWHWTMDHFDPDTVQWHGKREAASHDYPLIGLYDSGDRDALECHALLMKFSGIDGVILDWYGKRDFYDYATVHRNSEKLIPFLKKAGLKFAVCYEDQSVGHMIKGKAIAESEGVGEGKKTIAWLRENWFADESYLQVKGKPVMLVFGPQHYSREQWSEVTKESDAAVYALPAHAEKNANDASFFWPPVRGGEWIHQPQWQKELQEFYESGAENRIGVAFPGFHDIYEKAGLHDSYGRIHARDGATFAETLSMALKSPAEFCQIATWNDFGEGTVIEPTTQNGYRYVEELQRQSGTKWSSSDLRLPVRLYQLRKQLSGSDAALDEAASALFAGDTATAEQKLNQLQEQQKQQPLSKGSKYRLVTDILYREENGIDRYARDRCRLDLYYPSGPKPYSTVIWFHGGGIEKGNKEIPMPLREKGVAVVAANYRLSPFVKEPTYIEDAAAAVAWVVKNIHRYGAGKPERVFVSGHSAGGYLASMVGLDKQYLQAFDVDADSLAGLIPFSGHTITHFTVRKERGIPKERAIVDELAPLFHVRKEAPPMLLITGDKEKELMGRYDENAYFYRMMKVAGHPKTELIELEGFDHGGMPEPAFPLLLDFVKEMVK